VRATIVEHLHGGTVVKGDDFLAGNVEQYIVARSRDLGAVAEKMPVAVPQGAIELAVILAHGLGPFRPALYRVPAGLGKPRRQRHLASTSVKSEARQELSL
jgi:hypothetical protein